MSGALLTEPEVPAGIALPLSIAAGGFAADGALAAALLVVLFIPAALLGGLDAALAADDGGELAGSELAEGALAVEGAELVAELPEVPLADVALGGVSLNFP